MSYESFRELNGQQVQALARLHIAEFQNKIRMGEAGSRNVNVGECERYLAIWKSTLAKAFDPDWASLLTQDEVGEIEDALFDGGYDEMLRSN